MPDTVPKICAWCGKPLAGEISHPSDKPGWCHDCSTTYGDVAVFQCLNCGRAPAGVKPGVTDTGYVVKPNQVLHIRRCPLCTPGITRTECVEFDDWERKMKGG